MRFTLHPLPRRADMTCMPPVWTDNLSSYSLEEILRSQVENREWYKRVRVQINTLIDSRLEKRIGSDEYSAGRTVMGADVTECRRRLQMLINEIAGRRQTSLNRNPRDKYLTAEC
jgi:hypothetical protein